MSCIRHQSNSGREGMDFILVFCLNVYSFHFLICSLLFFDVQFIILAVKNTVVGRVAVTICDDQEHLVDISISKGQILLTVDGSEGQSELNNTLLEENLSVLDEYLQSSVKTYVGGLPGDYQILQSRMQILF